MGSSPPNAEVHMVEQNKKTKLVQLGYELFTFYIIYFCCVLILKLHPSFFFLSHFVRQSALSQSNALNCSSLRSSIPRFCLMRILRLSGFSASQSAEEYWRQHVWRCSCACVCPIRSFASQTALSKVHCHLAMMSPPT